MKEILELSQYGFSAQQASKLNTTIKATRESLDKLGILYLEEDGKIFLTEPFASAMEKFNNFDHGLIENKYDFEPLILILKERELSKKQFCELLPCAPKEFPNIITYMSTAYPIYEDDNRMLGCL